MELQTLRSFSEELVKDAGVGDVVRRGAALLKGSELPRLARNEKLHSQAAKTIGGPHVRAAHEAFGRYADEAMKVHTARDLVGTGLAGGAAGGAYGLHKVNEDKVATDLSPDARAKLPKKDRLGDSADLAAVRAKIKAKYPDMLSKKASISATALSAFAKEAAGLMGRLAGEAAGHRMELGGLGILAAPSLDDAQAHVRAGLAGDYNAEGVKKRTVLPHAAKPISELAGLGVLAVPSAAHLLGH